MNESEIPYDWKCANVVPLFKKGNKNERQNYRPISLTSQVCTIFESKINLKTL